MILCFNIFYFLCVPCLSIPIAFCLTSKESSIISKSLWNVICMFGSPVVLNSGNGLEFCSAAVLAVLRKLTFNSPQRWVDWIDFVLMCIRTAVHRTSGFSPFQLMFGRIWNPLADYHQLAFDFEVVNSCGQGLAVVEDALVLRSRQLRMHLSCRWGAFKWRSPSGKSERRER